MRLRDLNAVRSAHMLVAVAASCALFACSSTTDGQARDGALGDEANATSGSSDAALAADASAADGGIAVSRDADAEQLDAGDAGASFYVDASADTDAALDIDAALPPIESLPYARGVVKFTPGDHAGFGQNKLPKVVLGPPKGIGTGGGSLDVLSLGVGGSIVLDFGDDDIVDEEGPDFIVFENAFWEGGDPKHVFAEPAQVAVSEDGSTWHSFDCDADGDGNGVYAGCAGWSPTLKYDVYKTVPLDQEVTGGDAFDLEDLGLSRVRYVRITDLATTATANTAGFDLDAVGVIHFDARL